MHKSEYLIKFAFPFSCEENGAVGKMELWGKYSLYSIKGSVGNEI